MTHIVGFRVIRTGKGLTDLLKCQARWGVNVTGRAERPEDVQVNDLLDIEGVEKRVYRNLGRCDPDWSGYLRRADP